MPWGPWEKSERGLPGIKTPEDVLEMKKSLLDSISVMEILDRIRNFRRLPFRYMTFEAIARELDHVINYPDPLSGKPTSVFHFHVGEYPVGYHFYRVRKEHPLKTVADCWCPPAAVMRPNRLNRPGQPALYTSPRNFTVAMDELQVRVGQTVSLISYRAKAKVVVTNIGVEHNYANLTEDQAIKFKMLTDFLYDEFTRDVAMGSEHRYQISNLIAENAHPVLPGGAGWCYPSTMRGGEHYNVCFVADTVHDFLELLGVIDTTPISANSPEWLLHYAAVGCPMEDGSLKYEAFNSEKHAWMIPGSKPATEGS